MLLLLTLQQEERRIKIIINVQKTIFSLYTFLDNIPNENKSIKTNKTTIHMRITI